MKTMKQRLTAVLCCVVLLITSLYVAEPRIADAAETVGTLTITSPSAKFTLGSDQGYLNMGYSTTVEDFGLYGDDFLTATFIEEYVTFGGGMTSADLMNGKNQFVIAGDGQTLQFNWNKRSTAFTEGWSFTIAQGAPISYRTNASGNPIAYLELDKEYTFTFQSGDDTCDNIVTIKGYYVEEFSLKGLDLWGNGLQGTSEIEFGNNLTKTPGSDKYTEIQNDAAYADYVSIANKKLEDLDDNVKIQYIALTNGKGYIQFKDWGSLRETMKIGDRIIFYKGLPIYYTDTTDAACRAVLDATYVYECVGSNDTNTHTFLGVKLDDTTEYGLNTNATGADTAPQGNEQYINLWFGASITTLSSHAVSEDILADTLAEDYIQVADMTLEQAKNHGMVIRFIPNAGSGCLQVAFSEAMVDALQVGDRILLKEGMPVAYVYSGAMYAATLDADYEIIVKSNDGTKLNVSYTLVDTYSLSGEVNGPGTNEDKRYYNIPIESEAFADVTSNTQASFGEVWKDYVTLSAHTTADFTSDGARMNWYLHSGFKAVRPYTDLEFEDGEVLMIKKGLPFTYTNTAGKAKTVYLDKDYGFVYSTATATGAFTYDPTLGNETEPEVPEVDTLAFAKATEPMFLEAPYYKVNFYYETEATLTADVEQTIISSDTETMGYIDIAGLDAAALTSLGVEVKFIPVANCFQMVLGETLDWLSVGDKITFKEGMPVYYLSGGVRKTVTLEKTATFTVANFDQIATQVGEFVRYGESAKFALATAAIGSRKGVAGSQTSINILDPATEAQTVLDDMSDNQYVTLSAEIVNSYIDFCGMTAEEVESAGVKFVLIHAGEDEVLQIQWGTSVDKMELGDRLIFKEGLPITYKTTDGYQKTITLCQDYIFEAGAGGVDDEYFFNYTEVKLGGTWALISGKDYTVGDDNNGTGYYSLIEFASCDLLSEVSSHYLKIDADVFSEYVSFGDVDPSTYSTSGVGATAIIDSANKVIQLWWGDTSEDMSVGDEIIFKAGMPILATATDGTKRLYTLDGDYSFILDSHSDSKNGFMITGIRKVQTTAQGDLDEDYLLNKNDVTLLRKQLIQLIELGDARIADATEDGVVNSKDLVRAKKGWDTAEPEDYTTIYKNNGISEVANGQEVTYAINADIDTKNYVRLTFKTTQNLYGTFHYTGDNGQSYTENFYLAKEDVQFEQFFDNYRANGMKVVGKTLVSITLKNVGTEAATVLLNEVEISDRAFENTDFLWAKNDSLKVGVDLNMGGALGYLESLKYNPVEVNDTSKNEIRIETDNSGTSYTPNVNLINIYDLGRQIQQAFYIDVEDSNYSAGTYNKQEWPYNPVQAGDALNNNGQIIDYRCVDTDGNDEIDMVYIKVRAMDWALNNSTTESYMENWYRLSGNLLYVDNAFVDWAGWQSIGEAKSQELPAVYTGQSLNYFVEGKNPGVREVYGSWTTEGERFHAEGEATSDWYAWVNEDANDAFGLGIYMPGAPACVAGRIKKTRSYSWDLTNVNSNADEAPMFKEEHVYINDLYKHEYQNCFLHNTSYIAPSIVVTLEEYRTYEYTYVLTAEKLDQMATAFDTVKDENPDMNATMDTWN